MGEVQRGGEPVGRQPVAAKPLLELIAAAHSEPGEWFSIPRPDGLTSTSMRTRMCQLISDHVADLSGKDGRIWVKFHESG